ncbi:MAG: hypothetical protein ACFE9S_00920 [Candidatus Hermodarchaeota archaeon]
MKINTFSDEFELDLYLKIIDYSQKEKIPREEVEIWKNQSIIELMKYLKRTQNRTFVTNALILILSLFEDIPPDLYNNRGVNFNRIAEKDKKFLIEELKEEFLAN